MFQSQDILIFVFLLNAETLKSVMPSETGVLFRCYTFNLFYIKMKFGQVLVQLMTNLCQLLLRCYATYVRYYATYIRY